MCRLCNTLDKNMQTVLPKWFYVSWENIWRMASTIWKCKYKTHARQIHCWKIKVITLLNVSRQMSSLLSLSRARDAQSLVCCVVFCGPLLVCHCWLFLLPVIILVVLLSFTVSDYQVNIIKLFLKWYYECKRRYPS